MIRFLKKSAGKAGGLSTRKCLLPQRFWQCMDTMRDKMFAGRTIEMAKRPWKVWHD
jgi:hypothetical protein